MAWSAACCVHMPRPLLCKVCLLPTLPFQIYSHILAPSPPCPRNIKLVLALGNLWPAYKGPEQFLAMAEGSAAGKDIASFYA